MPNIEGELCKTCGHSKTVHDGGLEGCSFSDPVRECQCEKFLPNIEMSAQERVWVPINSMEDLPEDGKQYLWQYRNLTNSFTVIYKPRQDALESWWVSEFIAWRPLPAPYQPQEGANAK